jgi:phage terminase large subunit
MLYSATTATKKIVQMSQKIRAIQGGTSASKTVSIVLYLIHLAQSDKTPTLTSIVAESLPHLKRGAIRDFLMIMEGHNYLKDSCWNKSDFTYEFETGSKIEFFSADQPDKLRGARRDRLFINEANNISFNAFEQLEVRTKEFVFLDWNPTSEFWFYTDIKDKRTDVEHITLTYKENEALSQEIIASIEQRKGRKGWWQVYGLGQLGEVEGKIYKEWQIIDTIPHEARLERYGIDFGYTNDPTSIVAVYYYNGGYILDEITFTQGLSNKNIADILLNQDKALAIADSAEPKSIDEIFGYGINITGAAKGQDSVKHGIQVVQDQKMSVTSKSVNIIKEYRNYLWQTDKDGKIINEPEHIFSHTMDAIRYAMVSLAPIKRQMEYNNILKKKEEISLIRQFDSHRNKKSFAGIGSQR